MTNSSSNFTNTAVIADHMPDYRRVKLNPAARAYFRYSLIVTAGFWLFLLILAFFLPRLPFVTIDFGPWPVFGVCVATVWFTTIAWLDAMRRGWVVREHDLIYRSGVIWRKTVIVPFARIQHVETASGPLERLFGLMRVKCFTAGGMTADLSVVGLDASSARQVRHFLLEQIRDDAQADAMVTDQTVAESRDHESA